ILQAGSAHGLPRVEGAEAIELALFPFDAPAEALSDLARSVGRARAVEVLPTSSVLEIEEIADPTEAATYKAIVVRLPLPAATVRLEGDGPAAARVREALDHAGPARGPSPYVREAREGDSPEFRLLERDGRWLIAGPADDRPLVDEIDARSEA